MLHVFRAIFVLICTIFGWQIGVETYDAAWWQGLLAGGGIGVCCILLELSFARRFISIISVLMFGVVVGFVVSHFVIAAMELIPVLRIDPADFQSRLSRDFGITFVFSFLSILAILHTKDDFKFVIPFIELKRQGHAGRPLLLDTSVIIDGRIADVVETHIIDGPLIIPQFVLQELQAVADSADNLKRQRGRRGLDILARMRQSSAVRIEVQDVTLPHIQEVDAKLIHLAKTTDARLATNDVNLAKVAKVEGVDVFNVNDLANAIKPAVLQGDRLSIRIVKPGENPGQGIGYLEDGTMVVGEGCSGHIGEELDLTVTNVLQTSAGRLIFARPADPA
jgi:uncharacterized protein YacL